MRHFWCQVCDGSLTNERTGIFYLANQKPAWVRQMLMSVTHTKLSRYLAQLHWPAFASHLKEFVSWYIMTTHQSGLVCIASNLFTSPQSPKPMENDCQNLFSELTFISLTLSQYCFVQFPSWCSFVENQRIPCRSCPVFDTFGSLQQISQISANNLSIHSFEVSLQAFEVKQTLRMSYEMLRQIEMELHCTACLFKQAWGTAFML